MCKFLPQGKANASETKGNTVSCRAHYAKLAGNLEQDKSSCPAAAPGGGSPGLATSCGENCEAYCGLFEAICDDDPQKEDNCVEKCQALRDRGGYSAKTDYATSDDTIQCRIAHLNAAAQAKRTKQDGVRKMHCGHAEIRAALGQREFCDVPPDTVPKCSEYCKLVQTFCSEHPVYQSEDECNTYCEKALDKGKTTDAMGNADSTSDTLACRRWHVYFAADDPMTHCPHASPTGGAGHCSDVCPVYCKQLKKGCSAKFDMQYPGAGGEAQCEKDCATVNGFAMVNMPYDITEESFSTNTLQCRFGSLVDVFNGKMDACNKAFPKDKCMR
jgi:hypothetical protein